MSIHPMTATIVAATLLTIGSVGPAVAIEPTAQNQPTSRPDGRSDAQAAVARARGLVASGDFDAAIAELGTAIGFDATLAEAYAWRAHAYARKNDFTSALSDYNQALKLNPKNPLALIGRGFAYFKTKDNGRGLADLNQAITLYPKRSGAYINRGLIYGDMGEQALALADFTTAAQIEPDFAPIHANLGFTYNKMQQFENAIASFNRAIAIDPNVAAIHSGRGFAYHNLDDNDHALADFNEAIRLDPRVGHFYVQRGRIYLSNGDSEHAISDFTTALGINSKSVNALLFRAKAYEQRNDLSNALADYQSVLALFPDHAMALAGQERLQRKLAALKGTPSSLGTLTGRRVALVIGNSSYAAVPQLPNPQRDAKYVADELRRTGFTSVTIVTDATRDDLLVKLKAFAADAASADWAVIYYAGHGIEFDGSNYLIPIDAKLQMDTDVPKQTIALDQLLNAVDGASQLRLVLLDACRDNPFASELKSTTEDSSIGRGLARIEPESGTLVAFATKHGHFAVDGSGANSPFASAFVQRVEMPGVEINRLFRLIHDDVFAATNGAQEPFTYGQLPAKQFYFRAQ